MENFSSSLKSESLLDFQPPHGPALTMLLVSMLRAAWIAGTLPILIASIPLPQLNPFRELLIGFAKRGKIMQSSSTRSSVPQKYFLHFYIVAVIWTTILLVATWLYAYRTAPALSEPLLYSSIASHLTGVSHELSFNKFHSSLRDHRYRVWKSVFLLLLMEAQVLRRLIESIYVFKYSPSARMHIFGYFTGLFFYTAAPLSLCCTYASEVFNFVENLFAEFIVKGKDRMQATEFDLLGHVTPLLQLKWSLWIGAAVFFWGWIHQRRCHAILGSLRENGNNVDDYAIPFGDWFEYVSSPHYLAEIILVLKEGMECRLLNLIYGETWLFSWDSMYVWIIAAILAWGLNVGVINDLSMPFSRTGSSKHETEPNISVFATEPPRGVCAVTQTPCFWQNFTSDSLWK